MTSPPDTTDDRIDADEVNLIHAKLGAMVQRHVPQAVIAFTSGSLPYGGARRHRSDADVNVVLPSTAMADEALFGQLTGFVGAYAELHAEHGLRLDLRFPGEYFTVPQAWDAARGRGVPMRHAMPCLPADPDDAYWLRSEETWYLAWLGALAFSRHVAGDADLLTSLRREAWSTLLLVCLPDLESAPVTARAALARVLQRDHSRGGFGIHAGYRWFAEREEPTADAALVDLVARGILIRDDSDYRVDGVALADWHVEFAERHHAGFEAPALLTVESSQRLAR